MLRCGALLSLPNYMLLGRRRCLSTQDLENLSIAELRQLASQRQISLADCFEKRELVQKLKQDLSSSERTDMGARSRFASKSVAELRVLIHEAGLSSQDLLEKKDLLERAQEAERLLSERNSTHSNNEQKASEDAKASLPWDARRYQELEVVLFARGGCPHCVSAFTLLNSRVKDYELQDVEWSKEAVQEFQRLGGKGVPFFYSRKTGKSASGWKPGAEDLQWLIHRLE